MICKSALKRGGILHSIADFSGSQEDTCALFQPLFQCSGSTSAAQSSSEQKAAVLIKEAKEKGFKEGWKIGAAEARNAQMETLVPVLKSFMKCCDDLALLERLVRTRACNGMTRLALAIAESILGEPARMDLDQLHQDIQKMLQEVDRHYAISLHPDDLNALRATLSEAGCEWSDFMNILIQGKSVMQRGEIRTEDPAQRHPFLEEKILQAFSEMLSAPPGGASR